MEELPIRVLQVFGKRPVGGVGTFLMNMHSHINRSKVQFDYLINAAEPEGEFDLKVKALGGRVYVLPELSYQNTFKYLAELNKFFKQHHEYKIIHVHSVNIGIFNFFLAKKHGIPHRIAHSHNTKYSDKTMNGVRNFFLQLPIKIQATNYLACGIEAAEFLYGEKYVKDNKVFIAKNGIETEKYRFDPQLRKNIREQLRVTGKLVIGHVGSFLPQKNHSHLIDVFQEIHKMNADTVLLLIGVGELETVIKEKVKRLDLEQAVMFLGKRDDVNELMQAFDVFVLPSHFEGVPLVGVEAQAAGLPCVFSDKVPSEVKITNLVDFYDIKKSPNQWAQKIMNFSCRTSRKDTYNSIVNAGYDIHSAVNELERYYIGLL